MMKEGIPSEPSPVDGLRCLVAVLTSSAKMVDILSQNFQMRGSACWRRQTVFGFKVMGKGISDDVRIRNDRTISFQV